MSFARRRLPALLLFASLPLACNEQGVLDLRVDREADITDLRIPRGFDFRTDRDVPVRLTFPDGHPARDTGRFRIRLGVGADAPLQVDGTMMPDGSFQTLLRVPAHIETLTLEYDAGDSTERTTLDATGSEIAWAGAASTLASAQGTLPGIAATLPLPYGWRDASDDGSLIAAVPVDLEHYPIATVSYYPSQSSWGTIAFEDNWPSIGDYDFNDLVLSYHVVMYRNPSGSVVAMEFFLKPEAVGAGFRNGFGFSLPVDPKRVHFAEGALSRLQNEVGLEPGQSQAVVVAFDDPATLLPGTGIRNTLPGSSMVDGAQQRIVMHFQTPLRQEELGTPPFNPFLIVNGDRSREIHLIGMPATDLGGGFVGTADDRGGYRSASGLPWGILLPGSWAWPAEKEPVHLGHLEFTDWAESGGFTHTDWWADKGNNRDRTRLFLR